MGTVARRGTARLPGVKTSIGDAAGGEAAAKPEDGDATAKPATTAPAGDAVTAKSGTAEKADGKPSEQQTVERQASGHGCRGGTTQRHGRPATRKRESRETARTRSPTAPPLLAGGKTRLAAGTGVRCRGRSCEPGADFEASAVVTQGSGCRRRWAFSTNRRGEAKSRRGGGTIPADAGRLSR